MCNYLLSPYVQGFYVCFLFIHTFPENVKDEILGFYLPLHGLKIKAVGIMDELFFKPKFACLTFVEGHCCNIGFYSYEKQMSDSFYKTIHQ